jgi:threonine dehydrogenase-like Zn-dependent dehydrogenase
MRGVMMYGPGDVRVEERDEPRVVEETDAIIRVSAACVCGSDLWPYRGIGADGVEWPAPMGHEYAGIVEEVGAAVETIEPGQFVVGSFWPRTTPVSSAGTGITAPASTACRWERWVPRPSSCASRSRTNPRRNTGHP